MTKAIKPIGSRVVIQLETPNEMSKGGIYIGVMETKIQYGTALAVGPNVTQVAAGDRVLFTQWASTTRLDDVDVAIIKEEDLLGVL